MSSALTEIPNVGPKVADKLRRLNVHSAADLRGRDPHELFERLCTLDGHRHDPCLLDTFVAAVDYAGGGPPRPWWEYSRERKAREPGLDQAGEVLGVAADATEATRSPRVQPRQPERVEPRHGGLAADMSQAAATVEDRRVDRAVIGGEADAPHDAADARRHNIQL